MTSIRDLIIRTVRKDSGFISTRLLQKGLNQRLILPFYHAISDDDCPHISHLYHVKDVRAFTDDLDFLLRHYTPIGYDEFEELASHQKLPGKPSFLLSFDDGLKEFYEVIAPILLRKGIPAICFLNSGFINNKDLFYRYKASLIIEKMYKDPESKKRLEIQYQGLDDIVSYIYSLNYMNKEILDQMADFINLDFDVFLSRQAPYLNTTQIHSLIKQGFYFGAHSIDHPEYQYIDFNEQIRQTKTSIEDITHRFNLSYKIFSFPFTDYNVSRQFFTQIEEDDITDYTFGSAGQKQENVPTHYQRIPFDFKRFNARQIHHAELLYYAMKIPLGKNSMSR